MLNSKFRLINLSWQIIKLSLIYDPFKLSLNITLIKLVGIDGSDVLSLV